MAAPMEIALGMLLQGDRYLLQRRPIDPSIGAAGLIGCFGGKINAHEEESESPLCAVCREIKEETNFCPDALDALYLGDVSVISDFQSRIALVHAEIFHFEIPDEYPFEAREGKVVAMTEPEVRHQLSVMTPATRDAFIKFIFGDI